MPIFSRFMAEGGTDGIYQTDKVCKLIDQNQFIPKIFHNKYFKHPLKSLCCSLVHLFSKRSVQREVFCSLAEWNFTLSEFIRQLSVSLITSYYFL